MVAQIVDIQQIVITVLFLLCLIGLLVFLRMKGGLIKANLQKGQRIKVIEETAVSPAERLRLITIDSHEFVMLSGKGIQPSLVPLLPASQQIAKLPMGPTFASDEQLTGQLATTKPISEQDPLELTIPAFPHSKHTTELLPGQDIDPHQMDPEEIASFAAKFKGWRKKS